MRLASGIVAGLLTKDTDYAKYFNGTARGFAFRGAYAGEGTNPGSDGGNGATPGTDGGCSCRAGSRAPDANVPAWLAAFTVLVVRRRRRA